MDQRIRRNSSEQLEFYCPACRCPHAVTRGWTFNDDFERPTLAPSVLVTGYRFIHRPDGTVDDAESDKPENRQPIRCHSYVTDGRIQFLPDSNHDMAGTTVALPEFR